MSRPTLIALLTALAVLVAGGVPAGAAAATTHTCKTAKGKKLRYKGSKRPKACRKVKAKPKAPADPATPTNGPGPAGSPVSMLVHEGSNVTLDLGGGRIRTFPLEGRLRGYIDGGYHRGADTTLRFTHGSLAVGPTDTLMDECPAPALARTNPATTVTLDGSKDSLMTIAASGAVKFRINMVVRVVLDLRGDAGCGGPSRTSGYADTVGSVPLGGSTDAALTPFELSSNLFPLRLNACYTPAAPDQQCPFAPTGLLSAASVRLLVDVDVG
jgi:hypothetical protein